MLYRIQEWEFSGHVMRAWRFMLSTRRDASLSSILSFDLPQDRHTPSLNEFSKMPAVKQAPTRQAITLKGSTSLVTEFFKYAANTSVGTAA